MTGASEQRESIQQTRYATSPLLRVSVLGPLSIEWVREDGKTCPLPTERLSGRGAAPALGLLKALLSRPDRFATRDWLMEQFWPESDLHKAEERLDDVASGLRSLLRSSEHTTKFLHYVYGSTGRGGGYRLDAYPLIWVDAEAFEWYVKQAARFERFGEDALLLWEQAYQLAARGVYLSEESYSDWAIARRETLAGHYRQCIHRLTTLLRERGAREQAILHLRTYWQQEKTDEDALRVLMDLLGEQERYQEAEAYYQQLLLALAELESTEDEQPQQPDQRTQDLRELLRTKQFQRELVQSTIIKAVEENSTVALHFLSQRPITVLPDVDRSIDQMLLPHSTSMFLSLPSAFRSDNDVLACLSTILSKPSVVSEKEITYFDQQTRLYWQAREETALPTPTLYAHVIRHIDDINMLLVRSHLPRLREYLCEVACRSVLLAGILLYDMGQYTQARQQYQVALQAAVEANSPILQAIVWGWMSFTWTYTKHYPEALRSVQYARSLASPTSDDTVQAWLGAIEAEIHAHQHHRDACMQALTDMERGIGVSPSQDSAYLFEFNPALFFGYKGICLQQFYRRQEPTTDGFLQEAKEALELALASEAPLKRKLYYLNDLAGVYARQGDAETACTHILKSLPLITQVGRGAKTIRKHLLQVRTLLQPYERTSCVQSLDKQITPLLIE